MVIAIGADHGGFELKNELIEHFKKNGIEYKDAGIFSCDSVDYPDFAEKVAELVLGGVCEKGIVICGTGIGISISANKIPGIRCALCGNEYSARMTRLHNDANILALGGRVIGAELAKSISDTFINTPFSNEERHKRRVHKISQIEKKYK